MMSQVVPAGKAATSRSFKGDEVARLAMKIVRRDVVYRMIAEMVSQCKRFRFVENEASEGMKSLILDRFRLLPVPFIPSYQL
jgi:hypothetical protein